MTGSCNASCCEVDQDQAGSTAIFAEVVQLAAFSGGLFMPVALSKTSAIQLKASQEFRE
jgi:hypothetical protein